MYNESGSVFDTELNESNSDFSFEFNGGGSDDYKKILTTSNKTALTGFSGRVTNVAGGYETSNGYCYIYVDALVTSTLVNTANGSWVLYDGLPTPEFVTPLEIVIFDKTTGEVIQSGGCCIRSDGKIVHKKAATYTTNTSIIINGMYKIA